jgi:Cd2+/Zn2+-exporting ATPase
VSVVSALTNASKSGVLIKGGEFLERLTDIKVVAFDKTGTLTEGRLQVSDIHALNGYSEEEVLHLAASLEAKSEHPIAKAITNRSGQQAVYEVARFEAKPGLGIAGDIDGNRFFAGRPEMFHETEIELPEEFDEFAAQGKTVIFLADSERILGIITLEDTIRGVSAELVENLRKNQLKAVLLTGDNEEAARSLAERLGISRYFSGLLPEEKLRLIDELEKEEGPVAMVGDGINDAPALARASIGIAMGGIGTDMALESADVVLMSDNLAQLPYLFALSRSARRIIRQNIWASILIKVSLAMGTFFGLVSLVLAVLIGDMGATLLVTGNAMRLVKK